MCFFFCDRKKSQAAVFLGVPAPECKRRVKEAMDRVALQAERRIAIFDGACPGGDGMIFQSIKMAGNSIASNKMCSFLTMLGIIIGVASLIVLVSIADGAIRK